MSNTLAQASNVHACSFFTPFESEIDLNLIFSYDSFDSLLQVPFKTELVTVLKRLKESTLEGKNSLKIVFADKYGFS